MSNLHILVPFFEFSPQFMAVLGERKEVKLKTDRGLDGRYNLWEHTPPPEAPHRASFDVCGESKLDINLLSSFSRRRSQVVRQRSAKPLFIGSIPIAASNLFNYLQEVNVSHLSF